MQRPVTCPRRHRVGAVVVVGLSLSSTGCIPQNSYATPRTTPQGKVSGLVALEYGWRPGRPPLDSTSLNAPFPSGAVRYGLSERVEVGGHAAMVAVIAPQSFGGDIKWNAIRSKHFDLGLQLRTTYSLGSSAQRGRDDQARFNDLQDGGGLFQVPLLVAVNAGPVTFLGFASPVTFLDNNGRVTEAIRAGGGIQVRIAGDVALQPEVSWMNDVVGPSDLNYVVTGIGILFKHLPYS